MWDRNEVLVATICFTVLICNLTADNGKLLDTASDVVDDLYSGCRQQAMEKFILSGLLKQELNNSVEFQKAWTFNSECSALIPGGIQAHTSALSAFVRGDADFVEAFNNAVETMGVNVSTYENNFHFKALHFLLMDAMTLLKPKKCQNVFTLWEKERSKPKKGSIVRFGRFTSATSNFQTLKSFHDFDGQVLLNITSCFFVSVGEHICDKDRDKVLLSPAEDFIVEEVQKINDEDNEAQYTKIVLKSSQLNSTHNCFIFSRSPAAIPTLWLVSALVIFSFLYSAA